MGSGVDDYTIIPPMLSVRLENSLDVMYAGNTTRRIADLLGFAPIFQSRLACAATALAGLVVKTNTSHTLTVNGIQSGMRTGIQITCETPWLASAPIDAVKRTLEDKVGSLVDETDFCIYTSSPSITLAMWLVSERKRNSCA